LIWKLEVFTPSIQIIIEKSVKLGASHEVISIGKDKRLTKGKKGLKKKA
jgi:hypothetical protein